LVNVIEEFGHEANDTLRAGKTKRAGRFSGSRRKRQVRRASDGSPGACPGRPGRLTLTRQADSGQAQQRHARQQECHGLATSEIRKERIDNGLSGRRRLENRQEKEHRHWQQSPVHVESIPPCRSMLMHRALQVERQRLVMV
jgi:hypothetical protein